MQLSSFTAKDYLLSSSTSPLAIRFRDKERSIHSLFWTLFDNLNQGKKTVVVIDNAEDLEPLNYLLSRYGLKELSLILQDDTINHPYLQTKKVAQEKLKPRLFDQASDFKEQKRQLENLVSDSTDALYRLRIPQLGSISITGINDKLELGSELPVEIDHSILKPPYTYEAYKSRKALYEKLQSEYHVSFDHLRKQDPFNESIAEVDSFSSVAAVLQDVLEQAEELLRRYEVVERSILKKYEGENSSRLIEIKKKVFRVRSMIIDNSSPSETEVAKLIFHQQELFELLDLKKAPPSSAAELQSGLELINITVELKLSNEFTLVQQKTEDYLKMLTPHSDAEKVHDISTLIDSVNNLSKELSELNLLKQTPDAKSVAFFFQKKNLEALKEQVDYALYFISAHKDYLNWKSNDRFLTREDHLIIQHLSKKNQFWGEAFEDLFLHYYLDHTKPTLDSAQSLLSETEYHSTGYLNGLSSTLQIKCFESELDYNQLSALKSWSQVLDQKTKLRERFPMLLVNSVFYKRNAEKLVAGTDAFIYFNMIPDFNFEEEWLSNLYLGYDPIFWEHSNRLLEELPAVKTKDEEDICYNVNRAFKHLSPSEVTYATKYLGQELCKHNPDFRLYQLRNASIISCLSDEKNVYLLNALRDEGVKEIFNTTSAANLIPGLFHESTGNVFLLVEDGVLAVKENLNLIPQLQLIQQVKTAGIKVISIDNFQMINNGFEMMEDLIRRIKKTNVKVNEPALT